MLKLLNSSYRSLCCTTTLLPSDLSVRALCFNLKGQGSLTRLACRRFAKTYFSNSARTCESFGLKISSEITNSQNIIFFKPINLDNILKMSENERPDVQHVSYGGAFEVSDVPSSSEEVPQYVPASEDASDCDDTLNEPIRRTPRAPPDFRRWESVNRSERTEGSSFKFKVVSYNVLAQYLLEWHPYLYRECEAHSLKWKFRSQLLYEEIVNLAPDILCLQEVEAGHLPTFYTKLQHLGYYCIVKQRTGNRHDGCAIYFKHSVFELQDSLSVEFYQPDLPILNRDNIGLMVKLVPRCMPDSPLIVATTHLLFNPKRTDVRLAQMQVFLAEIDRFAASSRKGNGHLPIILTGDLNSLPSSAVVDLLSSGNIRADLYRESVDDWKKIGVTDNCQHLAVYLNRLKGDHNLVDQKKLMIYNSEYTSFPVSPNLPPCKDDMDGNHALFNSGNVAHSLKLTSVYNHTKRDGRTEATTFQNYWVTVDYIYFSSQSGLNLLERLYLPTAEECEILKALPNDDYGSDHLALGAVFELKPLKSSL